MTKLRFLVSLITQDNDYQMEQAAAAKAAAGNSALRLRSFMPTTIPSLKAPRYSEPSRRNPRFGQRHPHRTSRCHFFPASGQRRR